MHDNSELMDQIKVSMIWTLGLSVIFWFLVPNARPVWQLSNALALGSLPGLTMACFRVARRWGFGDSFAFATAKMRQVLKREKLNHKIERGKADQQDLEEADELQRKGSYRDFHDYLMHKEDPKPVKALFLVNGAALLCAAALTFV